MVNEQELIGFEGHLVLEHTVLRDANTHQACSHRADTSNHGGSFKTRDDPGHQGTSHKNRPQARYSKRRGTKQESPESASESSHFAPVHHAVASVVVPDYMFIRVRVPRGD